MEDEPNFCGLLRISELYKETVLFHSRNVCCFYYSDLGFCFVFSITSIVWDGWIHLLVNIGVSTVQSRVRDIKFIPKVPLNQECTVCGAEKAYVTH